MYHRNQTINLQCKLIDWFQSNLSLYQFVNSPEYKNQILYKTHKYDLRVYILHALDSCLGKMFKKHAEVTMSYEHELFSKKPADATTIRVWSDGPSNQFKNKYVVSSLGKLSRKHKVHVICSCSATIHGKGPVDGVVTTVKREAGQKICPKQLSNNNLDDFEKAVANLKSIKTTKILSLLPSLSLKNSLRITSSSKNYSIPLHMPCKWSY